jgi:hypothetical protein
LKVVARPVIVGWRLFNLKEHLGTRSAAKKERSATGVHARKPSFAHISPADKTETVGWQKCERFLRRTGVFQGNGHIVIHGLPGMTASKVHGSGTFSTVHLI